MIHGRFQPFHLEHLRYFQIAWERLDRVLIGITNPDPSTVVLDELSGHRHLPEENPFTFTERLMIRECLEEGGYDDDRIFIVPFPIHHPGKWPYYVPPGTAMFVVAYSPWELKKAGRLRDGGLHVVVEEGFTKGISGSQVRALIRAEGEWEHLFPPFVARFIRRRLKIGA